MLHLALVREAYLCIEPVVKTQKRNISTWVRKKPKIIQKPWHGAGEMVQLLRVLILEKDPYLIFSTNMPVPNHP